jgi:hypothetical protein
LAHCAPQIDRHRQGAERPEECLVEADSGLDSHAIEVRRECGPQLKKLEDVSNVTIADFLTSSAQTARHFSAVVTKPPYSLAEDLLRRALEISDHVVLLLRLNFLASDKRAALMRANTPDVYVLPNRPSFNGHGTDSIDYAWFHWRAGGNGEGSLRVLPETSAQERRHRIVQ